MPLDFSVTSAAVQPEFLNWGQRLLQLPRVWQKSRGKGIRVAIVDTGMAVAHPDLQHAVVASRDFSGSVAGIADEHGHGTHVAGIVAALDDERGVVGVAPDAELLNAKVLRTPGSPIDEAQVAVAIRWAAVEEGARIICVSITWQQPVPLIHEAIKEVTALSPPVLVVCAAGNRGPESGTVEFPARYPETLAVGYVTVGPDGIPRHAGNTAAGPEVDVVAPGGEILSTFPPSIYAVASGSSMAAPFVAGALALLLAHRRDRGQSAPDLARVRTLIRRTSKDLFKAGRDVFSGWGLIDPESFLSESDD